MNLRCLFATKDKSTSKILMVFCIFLMILGLIIHCSCQTILDSKRFTVDINEPYIVNYNIEKSLFKTHYRLNIRYYVSNQTSNNTEIYIFDFNEYQRYISSSLSLEELNPIIDSDYLFNPNNDLADFKGSISLNNTKNIDIYIIILNKNIENYRGFLYVSLIPETYSFSLYIVLLGVILLFIVIIIDLEGWHKSLAIGIGVNIIVFLFRISTMGSYNGLGIQRSYLHIHLSDSINFDLVTPEAFNDFEYWYMSWISPFLKGSFPYGINYSSKVVGYEMPPLFLIILALFSLIPFVPMWKIGIPIFSAFIGTGILLILISQQIVDEGRKDSVSQIISFFYYLNPLSILYGSFCLLNPSLFIFFLILAYFAALNGEKAYKLHQLTFNNFDLTFFILGVATMIKQFPAVFFPLLIMFSIKYRNISNKKEIIRYLIRYFTLYIGTIIFISIPFIFADLQALITSTLITTTHFDTEFTKIIAYSFPVNFNSFFVWIGVIPDIFTDIIGFFLIWWIPLIVSVLLVFIFYWIETERLKQNLIKLDEHEYMKIEKKFQFRNISFWSLILVFCINFFYPRGVYKYYWLLLIPFLSLTLFINTKYADYQNKNDNISIDSENRSILRALVIPNLLLGIIVLINRWVYFWIFMIWFVFIFTQKFLILKQIKKEEYKYSIDGYLVE